MKNFICLVKFLSILLIVCCAIELSSCNKKKNRPPKINLMFDLEKVAKEFGVEIKGVIHIGAHEGIEVINEYQKMNVSHVLFIEANPMVYHRLLKNLENYPQAKALNYAIANFNGKVNLHITSEDQSSSILPLKDHLKIYPKIVEVSLVEVEARALDSLVNEKIINPQDFNFINIDIQGAELLALQGGVELLKSIDAINTEINFAELYAGGVMAEELDRFLGEQGFARVKTTTPYHHTWGDAFYVKRKIGSQ